MATPSSRSSGLFVQRLHFRAIEAIVAGRRDRALADAPEFQYAIVAEILLLIETLERTPS